MFKFHFYAPAAAKHTKEEHQIFVLHLSIIMTCSHQEIKNLIYYTRKKTNLNHSVTTEHLDNTASNLKY